MPRPIYPRVWITRPRFLIATAAAVLLIGSLLLYSRRRDRPVLYYYGASPEVAQGTAIAILNPFRDRKDERNAEWLIRDLRTNKCEQIVRDRLSSNPARICAVMQRSTKASLIWLDPVGENAAWTTSRDLYYDLPESRSRLVVHFGNSEPGWGVNTIDLLR